MTERKRLLLAPENVRARVKQMINDLGTVETAAQLNISRDAVARIAGGLEIRLGTLSVVEQILAKTPIKPVGGSAR
jgi:hypothetical protein